MRNRKFVNLIFCFLVIGCGVLSSKAEDSKAAKYLAQYYSDEYDQEPDFPSSYESGNKVPSPAPTVYGPFLESAPEATEPETTVIDSKINLEAKYNQTIDEFNQGNFQSALRGFSEIIEIHPNFKEAFLSRGIVYRRLGKLEASTADFSRAISLDEYFVDAYLQRASNRIKISEANLAMADLEQALKIEPKNVSALLQRGNIKHSRKDYKAAIDDFSKVIALQENSAKAYFYRARAYSSVDQTSQAIDDYTKALVYQSKYPEALYNRAILRMRMRDLPAALADAEQAKSIYVSQNKSESVLKVDKLIQLIRDKSEAQ